jgi:hypothetical protein
MYVKDFDGMLESLGPNHCLQPMGFSPVSTHKGSRLRWHLRLLVIFWGGSAWKSSQGQAMFMRGGPLGSREPVDDILRGANILHMYRGGWQGRVGDL